MGQHAIDVYEVATITNEVDTIVKGVETDKDKDEEEEEEKEDNDDKWEVDNKNKEDNDIRTYSRRQNALFTR